MSVVRLDHLNIRAPRQVIEDVTEFYRKIFEMTPGPRPNFSTEGSWLYFGDHPYIHLTIDDDATAPGKNEHLNHIAFRCQGIENYTDRLKSANIAFSDLYVPELDITQLFIFDPAGIQIELNFLNERL